jgi:acetyl esterase/lipase
LAAAPAIAAALLCWLPVWQTPSIVAASRAAFAAAFPPAAAAAAVAGAPAPAPAGSALRSAPAPTPLNLGALFLGAPAPDVRAERGIAFLEETDADGRSYRFAADFWRPAGDGPFPVVIRVHGGAWVSGDKGAGNMGFMNRYLAGRGYAVFDIQYGLNRDAEFALKAPTPPELLGPFGIDDMVRQIGAFSAFLADNADRFAADPDRVFLSGGSAGGQLILAAALAASSGYAERRPGYGIDARLTVLGLAPFYPAVGGAAGLGISGSPELQQPIRLLSAAAPPALVYQGGLDGLVPLARVREFAAAYNAAGGGRMALIEFPTAGHGSDLEFWNCYNQVYVYFLDRFLDALAYPPSDGI